MCWQTVEQQFNPALAIASAVIAHFRKKNQSTVSNLLFFSKTVKFVSFLSEEKLLSGIARISDGDVHTQGDIFENGFHMTYSSNFGLLFQSPLPAIEVIGQTSHVENKTEVNIIIKLSALPRYIFPLAIGVIVIFYFLDKLGIIQSDGMSDTIAPLLSIPFFYGFLLLLYLRESSSCELYFGTMIRLIEGEIKNEL